MPTIDVKAARFFYRERGSGPVALFVHGYPFDSRMWLDQLDALADLRRCVAVDLRGFGSSGPVKGEPLTMDAHADDLAGVLDALQIVDVDLVGMSMGGYVALAFADRHRSRVRSLVLVDTKAGADDAAARANRESAVQQVVTEGRVELSERMSGSLLAPEPRAIAVGRVRTMIESTPYETIIGALEGMKVRPDRTELLSRLDLPVAVIVGEADKLTPPDVAEAMARELPDAVVTKIPGAGHVSPVERPVAVNEALRAHFSRVG